MDNYHAFTGRKIDPPSISENMTVSKLIEYFGSTGYNARRLAEAASIFKHMIDSNATICLTIAGAMTPAGIGGAIKIMIEKGFVDWIVSTGANIYHDLHFAYGLPVRQGHFNVDDDILYSKQIVRIYDVYIKETGTLQAQDIIVQNDVRNGMKYTSDLNSTADVSHTLGRVRKQIHIFLENHLQWRPSKMTFQSTSLRLVTPL